jgi:DNA-binding LytR/AlgR family response regulator
MKVLIIEDEPEQLSGLISFFKKEFSEFEIVGIRDIETAKKALKSNDFDLAILDIVINGVTIFNALKDISLEGKQLLFITGNQNFAIKAFEFYAVDYIMKPYSNKRLKESIEIALQRRRIQQSTSGNPYKLMLDDLSRSSIEAIALPVSNGQILVKLKDIIALSETKLGIEDAEIEVEYQSDTIGKYGLDFDGKNFVLTNQFTACLASDKCGIPTEKLKVSLGELQNTTINTCAPGGKCC